MDLDKTFKKKCLYKNKIYIKIKKEKTDNKVKIIFLVNIEYLRKHRLIFRTAYFKTIVLFKKGSMCTRFDFKNYVRIRET